MPSRPAHIVEWYRVDQSRRIRRVLGVGATLVTIGGLVVGLSFLTRQRHDVGVVEAFVGLLWVAAGSLQTVVRLQRVLRDDAHILLRTDALAMQAGTSEIAVAWDDIASARWDEQRTAVIVVRSSGEELVLDRPFAGIEGPQLVRRIEDAQRKSRFNLLR
jgi:hypothetical protein